MADENERNPLFKDAKLVEAYMFDVISQPGSRDLRITRGKSWKIPEEDMLEQLEDGKYAIFSMPPDYKSRFDFDRRVAELYFLSEKERKMAVLTYTWLPNSLPEVITDEFLSNLAPMFEQDYEKWQEQNKKYIPGKVTISPFAKKEFYKQFEEDADDQSWS